MIVKIKKNTVRHIYYALACVITFVFLFLGLPLSANDVLGLNVTNQSVLVKVNITNSAPTILLVDIESDPIDLTANGVTVVICNATVNDPDGYDDLKNVTATLYHNSTTSIASDDNNNHYTNISCGNCSLIPNTNSKNGSCICQFAVQYYANAGLWQCNMTVNDSFTLGDTLNSSFETFNEILGINVEDSVIDYGNLSVTQISRYVRENVTNGGNIPINISVYNYGGTNYSTGMNVSMVCDAGSNISFTNQRYYPGNNTAFSDMFNVTNQSTQIFNLTVPQRTDDNSLGNSSNSTYWRLQIPSGAAGICNGTLIFGAIDALNT